MSSTIDHQRIRNTARRVRLNVPEADVSVNDWLDIQENISVSLRFLVKESIERDGYIDVVNRRVEQQPRRGRPPLDVVDSNDNTQEQQDVVNTSSEDNAQNAVTGSNQFSVDDIMASTRR